VIGTPIPVSVTPGSITSDINFELTHVVKYPYTQWIKINGTTTATIFDGGTMTITCNCYGTGSKVNIYIYYDKGIIGVLDADDWIIETLEIKDNSHIDEDSTAQKNSIKSISPLGYDICRQLHCSGN